MAFLKKLQIDPTPESKNFFNFFFLNFGDFFQLFKKKIFFWLGGGQKKFWGDFFGENFFLTFFFYYFFFLLSQQPHVSITNNHRAGPSARPEHTRSC